MLDVPNRTLPFAYLLPLIELLLCWTLLPAANPDIGRQLGMAVRGQAATTPPASEAERIAAAFKASTEWSATATQIVWLINMPGLWAEIVTSTSTWPESWYPPGFVDLFNWRAVLFPLAAMPFWFAAGRGIDWFLNRRRAPFRLGRTVTFLALAISLFGALLVLLGLSDDNPSLRSPALSNAMAMTGALWFLLGAIPVSAAIVQWRALRAARHVEQAGE